MVFHDQSLVIDGAWRILLGQVPYRDFSVPHPPLVFYLQALFFRLFGLGLWTAVIHASVMNLLATLFTYWGLRRVLEFGTFWGFYGALLTAFWFFLPLSWPWFDTGGYFFLMISLVLLWRGGRLGCLIAGVSCGLVFLSKANMALAAIIVVPLAILLFAPKGKRRSSLLFFSIGFGGLLGLWFSYLVLSQSLVPASVDLLLRAQKIGRLQHIMIFPQKSFGNGLVLGSFFLALYRLRMAKDPVTKRFLALALLLAAGLLIGGTFSSAAAAENNVVFLGWILPLLAVEGGEKGPTVPHPAKIILMTLGGLLIIYGFQHGFHRLSWRYGFGPYSDQKLVALGEPRLRGMRIQTPYGPELDGLLHWAHQNVRPEEGVLILPQLGLLYHVLDKTPPQPFIDLSPGFGLHQSLGDEERFLNSLKKAQPRWIFLETREQIVGHHRADQIFEYFPKLLEYVRQGYEFHQSLPGYDILRLREKS